MTCLLFMLLPLELRKVCAIRSKWPQRSHKSSRVLYKSSTVVCRWVIIHMVGEFGPSRKFSDEIVAPGAKVWIAGLGAYVRAVASPTPIPIPIPPSAFHPLQDWQSVLHWILNPVTYTHLHLIPPSVLSLPISRATN